MSATLLNIRNMARIKADQTDSTFPTDVEYNLLVNEAAKEVFTDLVMAGLDIGYTTVSVTVTSAPTAFAGTTEALTVLAVSYVRGGQFYELKRVNPGHVAMLRSTVGGFPEFYDIRRAFTATNPQTIEVFPPQASATISIDYIPAYTGMTVDADVWPGPTGTEDLISLRAAAAGLRKEGSDRDAYEMDKQYAVRFEKIALQVNRLDGRNGHQIRDVRGRTNGGLFDYQATGGSGGGDFGF